MLAGLVAAMLVSGGTAAHASGSSIVTLGLGAGVGVHKAGAPNGDPETAFMNQADIRLKLLHFLGVDFAYDLSHDAELSTPQAQGLQFRAKERLSILLYPYSGEKIGFYLGLGIGGTSLGEVTQVDSAGNSYHAGVGFELHLADHFSLDMSYMMVVPGMESIKRDAVAEVSAAYARGGADAVAKMHDPGIDDFVRIGNGEFMIRIFLFL